MTTTSTPEVDRALKKLLDKTKTLMEALPYIQRFRGSTVVIKYGGHAMVDDVLKEKFAQDIVMMRSVGINPVVVHGGGPEITSVMDRMGLQPQFHEGQRVTDAAALEVAEMVLAGKLNGEIVSRINQAGGRAVGLSGKDANLVLARKMLESGKDMGFVGEIESIQPQILNILSQNEFIPVISPIGAGVDGQTYNINADFVAAEIAAAIGARKLVLLTDVRGVMAVKGDLSTLIPTIKVEDIESLYQNKVIDGGMIPKVRACVKALLGGVKKAHILDGRLPHAILLELFTPEGVGTEIQ